MRVKVMCGDYSPHSAFLDVEGGCGHGYDGAWEIDGPEDLQCPGCGGKLDGKTLEMMWATFDAHETMAVAGGGHTFNFSRRTKEPYFAPEEEEIS